MWLNRGFSLTRKTHCWQRFIFRSSYSVHQIKTQKGKGLFKCSPVNFSVKWEIYCFPYFYTKIFPQLCGITFIVIFAINSYGNLVQIFNFIFFIKVCILENNFAFYVSCTYFKFAWKKCVLKFIYSSFYKFYNTLCACVEDNIFQVWPKMYVPMRSFPRVKTSS